MSALRYVTKLQGRRLLVLGGSSGIGFSVAEAALEHGADVIISSSNEAKLRKAVDRLRTGIVNPAIPLGSGPGSENQSSGSGTLSEESPRISSVTCDLANAATLEKNIASALELATAGRTCLLDHVVFTAGAPLKIVKVPDATVQAVQDTNLVRVVAPIILAKLLPLYTHQSAASSLTLTSGVTTNRPTPGWALLVSAGAAVEGLARGLAVDLKPLRVNVVSPGAVHTELFADIPEERLQSVLDTFKTNSLTDTVGTPGELAEAYLYCMKNTFATGSVIVADGGRLLV
ncbi:short-chain dehydrogenase [Verticillium alfalfae VaMs.102]|uniref:Short-chain dehydrogenase n=1 Tax=Verticillium alfalfae (strain VaMs.102 / ATCC MYA-4576 / FGSC 10136) TaxID=526221 RepID=C9SIV9_VERA1|nr:short-chain dehydrogenase [Verticillium alfalfae VaMs.102]EEY18882.1 short-chain dehydrogenase [Verticillium alfalfae VaMs.102]